MDERTFAPRIWRIRLWIRLCVLANALVWLSLGASTVFGGIPMGDNPLLGWVLLLVLALVPLYFAWWPRLELRVDGQLRVRGWLRGRTASAMQVTEMYMTPYGLRFEFGDQEPCTSVIFQSTAYRRYPRYFDVVEAITGERPSLDGYSPHDLGPSSLHEPLEPDISLGLGTVENLPEIVQQNREWVIAGEYRRAVDRMTGLIRSHADDLELRRATAQLYRELGNPDQAGRWGFIVPSAATELERALFIRSARQPGSPSLRRLLLLPNDYEVDGVERYEQVSPAPDAATRRWSASEHFASWFETVSYAVAALSLVASLLLLIGVYVATGIGVNAVSGSRTFGGIVTIGFGLAMVFVGMAQAARSHAWRATAWLLFGCLLTFGGILLFSVSATR
jgi:hypothetical protein